MKYFVSILAAVGLTAIQGWAQPQLVWMNFGSISNPQIDAINVTNAGYFSTYTELPFTTQNTRNFVNRGTMSGYPGFELSNYPEMDAPSPMDNFINRGSIVLEDYYYSLNGSSSSSAILNLYYSPPIVSVMATNLTHSGTIFAGGSSLVRFKGNNVNLANGGISASDVGTNYNVSSGSLYTSRSTNYNNPNQVTDLYWGIGANESLGRAEETAPLDIRRFGNLALYPESPYFDALDSSGYTNTSLTVPGSYYYYYDNYGYVTLGSSSSTTFMTAANLTYLTSTNLLVQVVFVQTNAADTNLAVETRFVSTLSGVNTSAKDVMVQFRLEDIDVVTGNPITNSIFLVDSLAAVTNRFYAVNSVAGTRRPNNFQFVRNLTASGNLSLWTSGSTGNTLYSSNLFYDTTFNNYFVTNAYTAYAVSLGLSSSITNYVTQGYSTSLTGYQNGALNDPTNSAGRVELLGDNLDLTDTRVRCDGLMTIKTTNLVSLSGAQLDVALCNLNLGSATPTLMVSNLLPPSVKRLKGQISAWSTVFTNYSIAEGPVGTNGLPTTNTTSVKFHVVFVGNTLETRQSVLLNEFIAGGASRYGTNVVLTDDLTVARNLRVDSTAFTTQGTFQVPAALGLSNFPNLLYFTNLGYLSVPSDAIFAQSSTSQPPTPSPYRAWVNYGLLACSGFYANADYFANQGGYADLSRYYGGVASSVPTSSSILYAMNGALQASFDVGVVDNATLYAYTDVILSGRRLYFNNSTLSSGQYSVYTNSTYGITESKSLGNLVLNATESLADSGWKASNQWACVGNIELSSRPASGDLLGTKISTLTPKFGVAWHKWAAQDRGAVAAGFVNNAALGWLVLDASQFAKINFEGADAHSALYVDYLEFRNYATNINSVFSINTNIVIYFANANLPVEKLDGRFGNRLRWVSSFVGPNSSTNLTLPSGQKQSFNVALVQSMEIDSDFDGTVNGLDSTPFYSGLRISLKPGSPRTAQLSILATGNGDRTTLEFSTNLLGTNWQFLKDFVNNGSDQVVTVTEPVSSAVPRYYRVRIDKTQ